MPSPPDIHQWQARRTTAWGRLAVVTLTLILLVVFARVVQLKINPDPRLTSVVGSAFSSRIEPARRGDLLDRRGRVIATTTIGHRLFIDPQLVEDLSTIAVDITAVIGGDPVEIDRQLHERRDSRYVVVRQLLEDWQAERVRAANIPGLMLEARPVREYPYGDLAATVVGLVGFEHTGLSGAEHRFQQQLDPQRGRLTYLRDAQRQALWIEPTGYEPGRSGSDARLSIDLVIQEVVQRRIDEAVDRHHAGGGRCIVLDPMTGEILAMYDVLRSRPGWDEQTQDPGRQKNPALGRIRCATDPYEPGSTFKPFTWSYATALSAASLDEVLDTPESVGYRTSYGRLIRDAHYYGPSTWRKVLVKSMNSGMAIIADRLTERQLQEAIAAFGFGEESGCNIPGESIGIITNTRDWNEYTQSSVAMGHEIAITPLQMVRGFSAFARDGTVPMLRITATANPDDQYRFIRRAIPEGIAHLTRAVMRDVMTQGTGRRAVSEKYTMFGKSGTAQLPKKQGGGYHENRYVSSFIAGAPAPEPRIVVLCVIDDPDRSKGHYGGEIAGPVVRDIVDEVLGYLGVPADGGDAEKVEW